MFSSTRSHIQPSPFHPPAASPLEYPGQHHPFVSLSSTTPTSSCSDSDNDQVILLDMNPNQRQGLPQQKEQQRMQANKPVTIKPGMSLEKNRVEAASVVIPPNTLLLNEADQVMNTLDRPMSMYDQGKIRVLQSARTPITLHDDVPHPPLCTDPQLLSTINSNSANQLKALSSSQGVINKMLDRQGKTPVPRKRKSSASVTVVSPTPTVSVSNSFLSPPLKSHTTSHYFSPVPTRNRSSDVGVSIPLKDCFEWQIESSNSYWTMRKEKVQLKMSTNCLELQSKDPILVFPEYLEYLYFCQSNDFNALVLQPNRSLYKQTLTLIFPSQHPALKSVLPVLKKFTETHSKPLKIFDDAQVFLDQMSKWCTGIPPGTELSYFESSTSHVVSSDDDSAFEMKNHIESFLPPNRMTRSQARKSSSPIVLDQAPSLSFHAPQFQHKQLYFRYPFQGHPSVPIFDGDVNRLEDKEYLNDSLIDFQLLYDFHQSRNASKCYLFNTFFLKRFSQATRQAMNRGLNLSSACEEGFQAVRKWTRGVDLFEKDFLIVPVCEHLHWFLAIVFYPRALLHEKTLDFQCRIVLFDSLSAHPRKGSVADHLKHYLYWEAQSKNKTLQSSPHVQVAKVHHQKNSYDCGLYLLQFVRSFLQDPEFCYHRLCENADLKQELFDDMIMITARLELRKLCESLKREYQKIERQVVLNDSSSSDSEIVIVERSEKNENSSKYLQLFEGEFNEEIIVEKVAENEENLVTIEESKVQNQITIEENDKNEIQEKPKRKLVDYD